MKNLNQYDSLEERIEAYLMGDMDNKESFQFESEMNSDPKLAEEVEVQKKAYEMVLGQQDKVFKSFLKDLKKNIPIDFSEAPEIDLEAEENASNIKDDAEKQGGARIISMASRRRKLIALAASLLILLGIPFLLGRLNTPAVLLGNNLEPYSSSTSVRGDGLAIAGVEKYNLKQFAEAINMFQAEPEYETNSDALFYIGTSNLYLGQYDQAIAQFETIENEFPLYVAKAKWNKALALLGKKDSEACKDVIDDLTTNHPESSYAEKAKKLEKKMGSTIWNLFN